MKNVKVILPILLSGVAFAAYGQTTSTSTVKPDNSKVNTRDRSAAEPTADKQKTNASDQKLTQDIRRSVMADKTLSTYAHNIKIVSQNGVVTLKGPVHSDAEVSNLVSKATAVTGSADKVVNQLSVKP